MWLLVFIPFILQAIAILFDEVYFHQKRGLPLWERIGHPLDTLSLMVCLIFILVIPYSAAMLKIYCGLAIFSCLMVTKDEFVHKHHCSGAENWLHALLFLLHPTVLATAALIWPALYKNEVTPWMESLLEHVNFLEMALMTQTIFIFTFFSYQIIFWNMIWKDKPVQRQ